MTKRRKDDKVAWKNALDELPRDTARRSRKRQKNDPASESLDDLMAGILAETATEAEAERRRRQAALDEKMEAERRLAMQREEERRQRALKRRAEEKQRREQAAARRTGMMAAISGETEAAPVEEKTTSDVSGELEAKLAIAEAERRQAEARAREAEARAQMVKLHTDSAAVEPARSNRGIFAVLGAAFAMMLALGCVGGAAVAIDHYSAAPQMMVARATVTPTTVESAAVDGSMVLAAKEEVKVEPEPKARPKPKPRPRPRPRPEVDKPDTPKPIIPLGDGGFDWGGE